MDYSKIVMVTFGLLLLLAMQTLGQITIPSTTTTKLPYSEWYTNRTLYKPSIFGTPPEERGRLQSFVYDLWVAEQEQNWRGK